MSGQDFAAETPAFRYTAELANEIEAAWQARWEAEGTFDAPNPVGDLEGDVGRDKYYVLDMFPYPSGKGLQVGARHGHWGTEAGASNKRRVGNNVL